MPYVDTDELEGIAYNIRKGYAVVTNENAFSRGITELYDSITFWDNMTEDEKKKYDPDYEEYE